MLKRMSERLHKDEGFTLIELMVVVLIIAVLVAIAIPSFLGFRKNAQDRSAQSDLRNALLAEQAWWTENNVYSTTEDELKTIEPSIDLDADSAVAVAVTTGAGSVCLERESASGGVFSIWVGESAGVGYAKAAATAPCPADDTTAPFTLPAGYTADGWK